ncbi:hypothetical protein SBDP1_590027 [Syntrophobacter sp. SbD1]|nr:hypothetical protein SBDP1_590027 [Syntrophobacter sp. SbD1]
MSSRFLSRDPAKKCKVNPPKRQTGQPGSQTGSAGSQTAQTGSGRSDPISHSLVRYGLVFPNFFNYFMPDIAGPNLIDSAPMTIPNNRTHDDSNWPVDPIRWRRRHEGPLLQQGISQCF